MIQINHDVNTINQLLTAAKMNGHYGLVYLDNGLNFRVKSKPSFASADLIIFTTACGKYIKHAGTYTLFTVSDETREA